jgi:transcriptional regulator with XRE-family HTH domain
MATQQPFIDWLQHELQQRGWNQAELARRSRLTTAQVSRIMTGEQSPGPVSCQKLARALHLQPEDVFRRAGLLPPAVKPPDGTEELVSLFSALSEADRRRLLIIARGLQEASGKTP